MMPTAQQGLGQVNTGYSLDQKEAIIIDITSKGISITVGESKRIDVAIVRDIIVGGLNAYLRDVDTACLKELKSMEAGR